MYLFSHCAEPLHNGKHCFSPYTLLGSAAPRLKKRSLEAVSWALVLLRRSGLELIKISQFNLNGRF